MINNTGSLTFTLFVFYAYVQILNIWQSDHTVCSYFMLSVLKLTALREEQLRVYATAQLFQHNPEGVTFKNTAIYKFEGMPLKSLMKHPQLRLINWDHLRGDWGQTEATATHHGSLPDSICLCGACVIEMTFIWSSFAPAFQASSNTVNVSYAECRNEIWIDTCWLI